MKINDIVMVALRRDLFADQFADAGDLRTMYWEEMSPTDKQQDTIDKFICLEFIPYRGEVHE